MTDTLPSSPQTTPKDASTRVSQACQRVCDRIAPIWPLDQAIAVNPHWHRTGEPLRRVAARLAVLGNIRVFPSRTHLRRAWESGQIRPEDLASALEQMARRGETVPDATTCIQALRHPPRITHLPLLIDLLDNAPARNKRLTWRYAITFQISQTCAAYFDTDQSDWHAPAREAGLYRFWRETVQHDHGIGTLMGLEGLADAFHALPESRDAAEHWVVEHVGLPDNVLEEYLEAVLLTVNGWASWCAGLAWRARLAGQQDTHLRELLAVRLAWGALLLKCCDPETLARERATLHKAWAEAPQRLAWAESELQVDDIWQLALDIAFQRQLLRRLPQRGGFTETTRPDVQAAFCIDVRSEPMRHALETVWPGIETLGVAGFFGLPARYRPLGTYTAFDLLPGLLAPHATLSEHYIAPSGETPPAPPPGALARTRQQRLHLGALWEDASRWPGTAFSYAENAGLLYLGKLWHWIMPPRQARKTPWQAGLNTTERQHWRPRLTELGIPGRTRLAAGLLRSMGLVHNFAPLVILVGHASQTTNNAHAAALECGACGGHSGEINARAAAALLNDPEVRHHLRDLGIEIPQYTWFMAALHNTTTDELEGLETDLLPASTLPRWRRFESVWAHASDQVRRKRAHALGLDPRLPAPKLVRQLRRRANDGACLVPEWGLANNAALIIAPRARTRHADLGGRVFLHEYRPETDPEGTVLEGLLTGPLLVSHWINWQYHASTCDPTHLGSGNKLLHNVVGGGIGVFEGNGGDLRIGLPRQSVLDRDGWRHDPVRLTVLIDAGQCAIDQIFSKHPVLRQLAENGWLHVWRFTESGYACRTAEGDWTEVNL